MNATGARKLRLRACIFEWRLHPRGRAPCAVRAWPVRALSRAPAEESSGLRLSTPLESSSWSRGAARPLPSPRSRPSLVSDSVRPSGVLQSARPLSGSRHLRRSVCPSGRRAVCSLALGLAARSASRPSGAASPLCARRRRSPSAASPHPHSSPSNDARLPAELKHITKRRRRN